MPLNESEYMLYTFPRFYVSLTLRWAYVRTIAEKSPVLGHFEWACSCCVDSDPSSLGYSAGTPWEA